MDQIIIGVLLILGFIIIFIFGYTILHFIPSHERFGILEKIPITFGIGTGGLTFSMFFCILLGIPARFSYIVPFIIILVLFFKLKIYHEFLHNFIALYRKIATVKRFKFIEFVAFFFIVAISIYILVKWAIFPERFMGMPLECGMLEQNICFIMEIWRISQQAVPILITQYWFH